MRLADFAGGISARGIEVAQRDPGQSVRPINIGQQLFDEQFRLPVWIDGALRVILVRVREKGELCST